MTVALVTFESAIAGLLNISLRKVYKFEHDNIIRYCRVLYTSREEDAKYLPNPNVIDALEKFLKVDDQKSDGNKWIAVDYDKEQEQVLTGKQIQQLKMA